jgi:hypothetical protein
MQVQPYLFFYGRCEEHSISTRVRLARKSKS